MWMNHWTSDGIFNDIANHHHHHLIIIFFVVVVVIIILLIILIKRYPFPDVEPNTMQTNNSGMETDIASLSRHLHSALIIIIVIVIMIILVVTLIIDIIIPIMPFALISSWSSSFPLVWDWDTPPTSWNSRWVKFRVCTDALLHACRNCYNHLFV